MKQFAFLCVALVALVRAEEEHATDPPSAIPDKDHYYFNSVTGESVWDVPPEYGYVSVDEESLGQRFYVVNGVSVWEKPKQWDFDEHKDPETGTPFYHNRHTDEKTWEKPACLGWERHEISGSEDL